MVDDLLTPDKSLRSFYADHFGGRAPNHLTLRIASSVLLGISNFHRTERYEDSVTIISFNHAIKTNMRSPTLVKHP